MQITNDVPASFVSSAARPSAVSLIGTAIRETISRRRLIRYLVRAQIKKQGTDTVLGNVWWLLDPLLSMMIYVIVMTFIFQRKTPDFPLFLLAAMIPFKWFTTAVSLSTTSVTTQGQLIKQIQFPKIVLPITTNGAELVNLGFGFVVLFAALLLFYPAHASAAIAWVPLIVAVQFVFTLGLSLMVASVTVFYRDVGILISHVMRLLFYLSPILWSFDDLAGRGGQLEAAVGKVGFQFLRYNPVSILMEAYRHAIYGVVNPDGATWSPAVGPNMELLGVTLLSSLLMCAVGILVFKRLEPAFAKVLG